MDIDVNDPMVEVHRSAYRAAVALLGGPAVTEEGALAAVQRLREEGQIVHAFDLDLPPHKRLFDVRRGRKSVSSWQSVWLTRSRETVPQGWWAFNEEGELSVGSPYKTKRKALAMTGDDSATYVDTGHYTAGGWTLVTTAVALEKGLIGV